MQNNTLTARIYLLASGLFGLMGIALAAMASHMDDTRLLGGASTMLLAHAPALLALAFGEKNLRTALPAGALMIAGCALFSGDMLSRHFLGTGLFPMSAPLGGMVMMAGWLLVALGALLKAKTMR